MKQEQKNNLLSIPKITKGLTIRCELHRRKYYIEKEKL